jgi:transcriptional regulator with XRE-family HTH domain
MPYAKKIEGFTGGREKFMPSTASRILGQNVRMLREKKKLKSKFVAEELWNAKPPYQTRIEKGEENLSLQKIIKLAEYFQVPVYRLFLDPAKTIIIQED